MKKKDIGQYKDILIILEYNNKINLPIICHITAWVKKRDINIQILEKIIYTQQKDM